MDAGRDDRAGRMVIGAALVIVGLLALAGRLVSVDLLGVGWPLIVIFGGVALFAAAVTTGSAAGTALAVPGGVVTMAGLVLAVQAATGLWATWAYAWALVAPGGIGIGLTVYGLLVRRSEIARSGVPILLVGLSLFLGFGLFFEGFVGLDRGVSGLPETVIAAGLVLLGAVVIVAGLLRRRT